MYTLIIGNKNLFLVHAPWLRAAGIAFTEQKLAFNTEAFARGVGEVSPAGLVPVLLDDEFAIWDSLAICEYLADRHPEAGLWPAQPQARAARVRWRRRCTAASPRCARPCR